MLVAPNPQLAVKDHAQGRLTQEGALLIPKVLLGATAAMPLHV